MGATFTAEDDKDAVDKAQRQLTTGQGAELWEWGRLVGRFATDHAFTSSA